MMLPVFAILPLLLVLETTETLQLHGYDCSAVTHFKKTSVNMVQPCPPPPPPSDTRQAYGALIQRTERTHIRVLQCHLTYVQTMYYCGMHSHISTKTNAVTTGRQDVSRADCIKAIHSGTIKVHKTTVDGVKVNKTTPWSEVICGSIRPTDGTCKGDSFKYRETDFTDVVVERDYRLTITESWSATDFSNDRITILNQLSCKFTDMSCTDEATGNFYWTPMPTRCESHSFASIYEGTIDILERSTAASPNQQFAVVNGPTHLFAVKLLANGTACHLTVSTTEHPLLYVFWLPPGTANPFPRLAPEYIDLPAYVNSKFLYSEIRLADRSANISSQVIHRRCLSERQILINKLQAAFHNPEEVSKIFETPGLIGRTVGELLYTATCPSTMVTLRRTEDCFDALPVFNHRNESMFLTPVTRILVSTAEPVPCDGPAPPSFIIGNDWYEFTPAPHRISPPTILAPDADDTLRYDVLDSISTAGLYSEKEMSQFVRLLSFPVTRTAIANTMARAMSGDDITEHHLDGTALFSTDQAARLVRNGFRRLWGWFGVIGDFMASIIGILFVAKVLKYLATTVINALAIREASGCTFAVLAAFGTALTQWLLRRGDVRRRRPPPQHDVEMALTDPMVPPVRPRVKLQLQETDSSGHQILNACSQQ